MQAALRAAESAEGETVVIENGQCWVRSEPDAADPANRMGVAQRGSAWKYENETTGTGWLRIRFGDWSGWVSGKYGRVK